MLTALIAAAALTLSPAVGSSAAVPCSRIEIELGGCDASGSSLEVSERTQSRAVTQQRRVSPPSFTGTVNSATQAQAPGPTTKPGFAAPTRPTSEWGTYPVARCITDNGNSCTVIPHAEPEPESDEPSPEAPAEEQTTRPLTVEDLASFAPAAPTLTADPEGTGIRGAHTNIVATAAAHTLTGDLFGSPVTVRFTPTVYTFDYGDGTTATHATGGATWDALNQPAFTATDTSHIYRERGVVTATVTTGYTADVTFDGTTWYTVQGTLTTAPIAHEITIYDAVTALVDETCDENPAGPAC